MLWQNLYTKLSHSSSHHMFSQTLLPSRSLLTLLALLAVSPGRVLSPLSLVWSVVQHLPGIGHWPLEDLPHSSRLPLPGGSLLPPNPTSLPNSAFLIMGSRCICLQGPYLIHLGPCAQHRVGTEQALGQCLLNEWMLEETEMNKQGPDKNRDKPSP